MTLGRFSSHCRAEGGALGLPTRGCTLSTRTSETSCGVVRGERSLGQGTQALTFPNAQALQACWSARATLASTPTRLSHSCLVGR